MDTLHTILGKLDLSNHDIVIYLTLLEKGELSITDISRFSRIHRPLIYRSLERLTNKQIVSTIPSGKRVRFVAESPKKLRGIVHDLLEEIEEVLPELEDMYTTKGNRPMIRFLEGKKGISAAFLDVVDSLGKGDIFYRYSSARDQDKVDTYVPKQYRKIRDNKQLERYVITNPKAGETKKPRMERDMRFITSDDAIFDQNVIQFMYGDKISLMDFNSNTAVIVENAAIADFQKRLFKTLFRRL